MLAAARREAGSVDVRSTCQKARSTRTRSASLRWSLAASWSGLSPDRGARAHRGPRDGSGRLGPHRGSIQRSRRADRTATRTAHRGSTSASASTIGGLWMQSRSASTTWEVSCTRTSAGGKRSKSLVRRCSSSRSPSSRSPSLVCEDLAQNDTVAELIRSVGPTIVFPALLDGPQLTSRWASRYASVLADDPGSAVLTLTSYGMVQRSRPRGSDVAPVIALWKEPSTGFREIPLETGAQAVLLTVCIDRAMRRSADGRSPVANGTQCFDAAVHQIRAVSAGSPIPRSRPAASVPNLLGSDELTILTAWAEAVAEALTYVPERAADVLKSARSGAPWRAAFRLPQPSPRLSQAIDLMAGAVEAAGPGVALSPGAFVAAAGHNGAGRRWARRLGSPSARGRARGAPYPATRLPRAGHLLGHPRLSPARLSRPVPGLTWAVICCRSASHYCEPLRP